MIVEIEKAGLDTYWYADRVGQVFPVVETPDRPDKYSLAYDRDWFICRDDCRELDQACDSGRLRILASLRADIEKSKRVVDSLIAEELGHGQE